MRAKVGTVVRCSRLILQNVNNILLQGVINNLKESVSSSHGSGEIAHISFFCTFILFLFLFLFFVQPQKVPHGFRQCFQKKTVSRDWVNFYDKVFTLCIHGWSGSLVAFRP